MFNAEKWLNQVRDEVRDLCQEDDQAYLTTLRATQERRRADLTPIYPMTSEEVTGSLLRP